MMHTNSVMIQCGPNSNTKVKKKKKNRTFKKNTFLRTTAILQKILPFDNMVCNKRMIIVLSIPTYYVVCLCNLKSNNLLVVVELSL